jgi:branched-chain amino acid transport system ATP-binding protein
VTDDVSFAVQEGEALGIIGPNGAGKSTLFNLITGQPDAAAGPSFRRAGRHRVPAMQRVHAGSGGFQIPQPFEHI